MPKKIRIILVILILMVISGVTSVGIYMRYFGGQQSVLGKRTTTSWQARRKVPTPTPTLTPSPTPSPSPILPSPTPIAASNKVWGAYAGIGTAEFLSLESKVGKKADMSGVFVHWGNENEFPVEWKTIAASRPNFNLVIYWEAMDYNKDINNQKEFSYDMITSGAWDTYINSFAASAKAYGYPVILIPFEEMNGDWYQWSGTIGSNTPEKHIAAYRYIRNKFRGINNVKFAWDVNNDSVPDTEVNSIAKYYPGDEYVDVIGVDGFNFGDPWQEYNSIFDRSLSVLKTYNKPIYIFSTACLDDPKKAAWITTLIDNVKADSRLNGFVWFNENKEKDWRIWSNSASLAAFKSAIGTY